MLDLGKEPSLFPLDLLRGRKKRTTMKKRAEKTLEEEEKAPRLQALNVGKAEKNRNGLRDPAEDTYTPRHG